ncbi:MAG: recombinase RecT [Telluria sp.]
MNMQTKGTPQPQQWELIIADAEPEFNAIALAASTPVNFASEQQYALQIMRTNSALQRCPTSSIRDAILNVAAVGLTLNPVAKLAYLVPRKGLCCLDISYRGLIKIAVESGAILAAKSVLVREHDQFRNNGPFQMPDHDYDPFAPSAQRGEIRGGYSVARLPSGIDVVEFVSREELEKIKRASATDKSKPDNPWNAWEDQMMLKSITRRGSKGWPPTERLAKAVALTQEADGFEIDVTPEAPQLTTRGGRPNPAAYAEAAVPAAPENNSQRADLLAYLEQEVVPQGSNAYSAIWKKLTRASRELVGAADHERLWELALAADGNTVAA